MEEREHGFGIYFEHTIVQSILHASSHAVLACCVSVVVCLQLRFVLVEVDGRSKATSSSTL